MVMVVMVMGMMKVGRVVNNTQGVMMRVMMMK